MSKKEWEWVEMNEKLISMNDWMSEYELIWEKSESESERWWMEVLESVRRW